MAGMNVWLLAILLLLPPLAAPAYVAVRATANHRLAAVQLASALFALILVLMSFAFDQSSAVDLALAASLLAVPGTYAYALFMERWL